MASNVACQDVVDEVVPDYELLPEIKVVNYWWITVNVLSLGGVYSIFAAFYHWFTVIKG